ncbi:hypothetical protein [Streptomyces sp. SPB074]|uniref:hypothetical protein n=1 Tax=Streptomyces sp. (strain SPB074) TaxID=465543 RepID=UPI00017FEBCD|nr:hypothetical protein [Streptomyces sp. SPB074]EDY44901.1 hypothetical protein SSBG_02800 [Streptomyces sp. SPB074]
MVVWGGVFAVLAGAGFGIAAWQGAFAEERGDIAAGDVCSNVPHRERAAEIFRSVLPENTSYSFAPLIKHGGDIFASGCDVYGGKLKDRKYLLNFYAHRTALGWTEALDGEVVRPEYGVGLEPFRAGDKAWAGPRMAFVGTTCREKTTKRPEMNRMVVAVIAQTPLEAGDAKSTSVLKELAVDFARQVHKDAECEVPARLPVG